MFCDVENLTKFSKNLGKSVKSTVGKIKIKINFPLVNNFVDLKIIFLEKFSKLFLGTFSNTCFVLVECVHNF